MPNKFEITRKLASEFPFVELLLDDELINNRNQLKQIIESANEEVVTIYPQINDENSKIEILKTCVELGADYITVKEDYPESSVIELFEFCKKRPKTKTIFAYHNYNNTPDIDSLYNILDIADKYGADYLKIACKANDGDECLRLLNLYSDKRFLKTFPKKLISLPMGENWKLLRAATLSLGAPFIFCSPDNTKFSAVGQMPYIDLKTILELSK
jgi:3-dehydroquinate dehydratase type I